VPSSANRVPESQPNFWQGSWPAIVRIIILEIVVLFALAVAFVCYLNWSSEAALSEFMSGPSAQVIRDHAPCDHRA
jgi:hypothetical protein